MCRCGTYGCVRCGSVGLVWGMSLSLCYGKEGDRSGGVCVWYERTIDSAQMMGPTHHRRT